MVIPHWIHEMDGKLNALPINTTTAGDFMLFLFTC